MTQIDFGAALRHPDMPTPFIEDVPPTPAPIDPYDMTPVKSALTPYLVQIDEMAVQADAVSIASDDDNTRAVEMGLQAKKLGKAIDEARKGFVAAPGEYVKSVNGLARGIIDKLSGIEMALKRKIGDYQHRVEMERRKAELEARKQAEELQRKLNEEAKAANVEPVKIEAPAVPKAAPVVRTAEGTSYQHKEWKFEVVKDADVPREFLVVDQGKIRQAVRDGIRTIPGVNIFEHTETRFRR